MVTLRSSPSYPHHPPNVLPSAAISNTTGPFEDPLSSVQVPVRRLPVTVPEITPSPYSYVPVTVLPDWTRAIRTSWPPPCHVVMYVPVQVVPALPVGSMTGFDGEADGAAPGIPGIPVQPADSRSIQRKRTQITIASRFIQQPSGNSGRIYFWVACRKNSSGFPRGT